MTRGGRDIYTLYLEASTVDPPPSTLYPTNNRNGDRWRRSSYATPKTASSRPSMSRKVRLLPSLPYSSSLPFPFSPFAISPTHPPTTSLIVLIQIHAPSLLPLPSASSLPPRPSACARLQARPTRACSSSWRSSNAGPTPPGETFPPLGPRTHPCSRSLLTSLLLPPASHLPPPTSLHLNFRDPKQDVWQAHDAGTPNTLNSQSQFPRCTCLGLASDEVDTSR